MTLTLPRQIELTTSGVNGRVAVGEVDGGVTVNSVNGKVSIGQATGAMRLSGVNGNIDAALAKLGARGINISGISGINGNIALRFSDDVNANLNVSGINGRVRAEVPNVQAQNEEKNAHNYRATIGAGGAPLDVNGVNGNLSLVRADAEQKGDQEATATPKTLHKAGE